MILLKNGNTTGKTYRIAGNILFCLIFRKNNNFKKNCAKQRVEQFQNEKNRAEKQVWPESIRFLGQKKRTGYPVLFEIPIGYTV